MSEMVTLWLVVLIVSIGVEVATLGLTSIWFAGGAAGGSDRCRISWTGLVTDPVIFCSISAAVIFHQTHRSQMF